MAYETKQDIAKFYADKALAVMIKTMDETCVAAQKTDQAYKFFKQQAMTEQAALDFTKAACVLASKQYDLSASFDVLIKAAKFTDDEDCSSAKKAAYFFNALWVATDKAFSTETKTAFDQKKKKFYSKTVLKAKQSFLNEVMVKQQKQSKYLTEQAADWTDWYSKTDAKYCIVKSANKKKMSEKAVKQSDAAKAQAAFAAANAMQSVQYKVSDDLVWVMDQIDTLDAAFVQSAKEKFFAKLKDAARKKAEYAKKKAEAEQQ